MFVLRAEIVTIFEPKMVTISAHVIQHIQNLQAIFSKPYNISQPNFCNFTDFIMFFLAVVFDSLLFTYIKI